MQTTVASTPHVRRLGIGVTIASVGAIALATLLPSSDSTAISIFCLVCGTLGGVDAILNVILFLPLGVGVGLTHLRPKSALLGMCALSAAIETTQFFFIAGRDATIADLVTNTLGGALGFVIARYALVWLRPSLRAAALLSVGASALWLTVQAISAFGFSLTIPSSQFYGEIAPRLGHFEVFQGRVLHASIADVMMPDTRFEDSHAVRELLLRGVTVNATFEPAGVSRGIAPIVRVADERQREIVLVGQNAEDLFFGVRTGAGSLHLRPPFFSLRNLFTSAPRVPGSVGIDTITFTGSYDRREARLQARADTAVYARRISITPGLGWTLVLPFQWFIEGTPTELAVSAIWMATLMLPIGYWTAATTKLSAARSPAKIRTTGTLMALASLYVGLAVIPKAFGLNAAAPVDWLAAVTGALAGAWLQALAARSNPSRTSIESASTGGHFVHSPPI